MILDGLNEEQKEAVLFQGHCLIQACPGSGKTHVLTRKIAYELERLEKAGNRKQYVVGLTFTNRAADEIKRRVSALGQSTKQLWIGTIHAFCLEWILRPYAGFHTHLKNGFVIIDETIAKDLKKKAKKEAGCDWHSHEINTRRNLQGDYVASPKVAPAIDRYYELLRENQYVDFNLLLYDSLELLMQQPHIGKYLSQVFKIILVDEFQDTQEYQYAIIHNIIKSNNGNTILYYVGDPNQAIYTSLGGVAKTKSDIEEDAGITLWTGISLRGCYRSTQRVIDFYSHYQVAPLTIWSRNLLIKDELGCITHDEMTSKDNLIKVIVELISNAKKRGIPDNDICVIAPAWFFLFNLGRQLRSHLPNVDFDAPGLFLFAADPFNTYYQMARLFLTRPSPRLLPYRSRWARELLNDLLVANNQVFPEEYCSTRNLLRLLNSISSDKQKGIEYLEEMTDTLIRILGINLETNFTLRTHRKSFFDSMENRIRKFPEVPTDTESLRKMFQRRKGVVLNSCHGIKGEEYDTVIAFGILEGRIPYKYAKHKEVEAKKMLYVISSRAKSHLHLISETGRGMGTTEIVEKHEYNFDPYPTSL